MTTEFYDSLIARLFESHTSVQSVGFTGDSFKPGLERMLAIDRHLGSPSGDFRSVHVAGTNGKGSVSSMLASVLASRGHKVGLFTSPHLTDFRERIKIITDSGFRLIPKESVAEFLRDESLFDGMSFFEICTEMAFWWFASEHIDYAVVEVGLGGRLDATNIITPALSVITSIGLDHCAILGGTRAAIAAEKAGIIKPGVPALVWGADPETFPVFEAQAAKVESRLHVAQVPSGAADILARMDLTGPCQQANLATVLSALPLLGITGDVARPICETAARTGFRGRWERIHEEPEAICDIAHNPPALRINFERLVSLNRPLTIVYGVMADKDLTSIARLMPSAARYVLVAPKSLRAMPVQTLESTLRRLRPDLQLQTAPSVREGVEKAYAMARDNELIYIGGSTFVVAEAL